MSLLVRVVDVVVLLRLFVLLGVVVDDAPGDVDAVSVTQMVRVCAVAVATPGWGPGGWRWWRLFASRAGVFGDAMLVCKPRKQFYRVMSPFSKLCLMIS